MSRIKVLSSSKFKDAHEIGFRDGLSGDSNQYQKPVNDYHKEYNRGYKSGKLMKGD